MKRMKIIAGVMAGLLTVMQLPVCASAGYAMGDPDGSGTVDCLDAVEILMDSAFYGMNGTHFLTEEQLKICDINADGEVDAFDASIVLIYAAASGTGDAPDDITEFWEMKQTEIPTLKKPVVKVSTRNMAAGISWSWDYAADGYEVYRSLSEESGYEKIAAVTDAEEYIDAMSSNSFYYYYKVRSYRTVNGATEYSEFSNAGETGTISSVLLCDDLQNGTGFPVYNRQCSEEDTTSYMCNLSENDKKILQNFIDENLSDCTTHEEMLWTTMMWIHNEVNYADTSAEWNEISGLSFTEAIFVHRTGQCAQYNGAMASMMAYLGYDVSLVQGYRGSYPGNIWQHFWVEIDLGGRLYIIECGNQGSDGDWWYFLSPYEETRRYVRNLVNM